MKRTYNSCYCENTPQAPKNDDPPKSPPQDGKLDKARPIAQDRCFCTYRSLCPGRTKRCCRLFRKGNSIALVHLRVCMGHEFEFVHEKSLAGYPPSVDVMPLTL